MTPGGCVQGIDVWKWTLVNRYPFYSSTHSDISNYYRYRFPWFLFTAIVHTDKRTIAFHAEKVAL